MERGCLKKELPSCSRPGCSDAAGVVFDAELLCARHANEALEQRRKACPDTRKTDGGNASR